MTTEDEDILQSMIVDQEDAEPIDQPITSQEDENFETNQVIAPTNDESMFYTLQELDAIEEDLAKQQLMYGGSSNNPHMLLMPQQYRARLYVLDVETRWIDIGTGNFRILLSKDG